MKTLLRLSRLIAPLFPVMALAVLFGTLGFFCAIGIPLAGALALTRQLPFRLLVLAGVARGVLHYAEQYCNHFIAFTLLARIRAMVFAKLRSLGAARLDGKQKGSLIALITSDIELLELFYAHTVSPVCIAFLVSVTMTAFLATQHYALSLLAAFCYAFVGVCVPLIVRGGALRAGERHRSEFADLNAFLLDTLRGLQQTILYGTGNARLSALNEKSAALAQSKKRMALQDGKTAALIEGSVVMSACAMLVLSLHLYRAGAIGFGTAVVAVTAAFSSFAPVIAVARLGSSLSETVAAGKRVLSLLDEAPVCAEVTDGADIGAADVAAHGARMESVSFAYPRMSATSQTADDSAVHGDAHNSGATRAVDDDAASGDNAPRMTAGGARYGNDALQAANGGVSCGEALVLRGISMDFPAGAVIGIQGKSGSGKSTLLKLLMRFWNASGGTVAVGGAEVGTIRTAHLRALEGYVTQDTVLFHDTIENNIRIARLDATPEEIAAACKKAAVHDFIMSLPNGYQTQVAELGDNFSGGERQRLSLARAFLHNSRLLLLDEPTSNLDSYNEAVILDAVRTSSAEKAVVLVSHRASTLAACSRVYQLDSGRQS